MRWPPERLGPLREVELRDSLAAVDVHEHHWLGHRDGELPRVPRDGAVAQVEVLLDEVRPDVVVTFGPDGMTGHDDHRTVSDWVTRAWQRTGRRSELWYATLTPEFHATWGELNQRLGVWYDGAVPPETPRDRLAAEVVCAGELLDRKHRALRAHASQTRPLEELLGTEDFRQLVRRRGLRLRCVGGGGAGTLRLRARRAAPPSGSNGSGTGLLHGRTMGA